VKQGDTKAAQQMVDEAAVKAGVNREIDPTKIRTFWRVGKPPEGGQSYNTKDQFFEKGVSTYFYPEATSFAGMDRSDWYKVSGEFVGYGSDGEPLVKVESFKKGTPREIDAALKKKPILQLLPGDSFRFPKYSSYADKFTVRSVKRRKDGSLYGYEISSSGIAKDYPIGTEIPNYRKLGPEYLAEDELGVTDITYAPITKDDAGNVIPLSQRFKASDDIRYMPAGDMATGRSVKDHREAMDLFEKGYRLYGALYDGMEDPIRLKKASEIEKYDPENLWAVPSKKIAAAISIRNMPADLMPSPDSAMPGAYSFPGGYRAIPGKAKGSLRLYGPAGSLIGIASSLDEAQRILRRKNK
jgi:hypothetical protein